MKAEEVKTRVIYTPKELNDWLDFIMLNGSGEARLVADVETFGTDPKNGKLLGVALCHISLPQYPVYVALQWYSHNSSTWNVNSDIESLLNKHLYQVAVLYDFIGHNYSYDKYWLDKVLNLDTTWHACTRLMWHMASSPSGPRPYGLKDAQVEVLGWAAKGNVKLNEQIKARGGAPGPDMYLADIDTLGHYASLDASSTVLLYNQLSSFFNEYDCWWLLDKMVEYSWLLQWNTEVGIRAEIPLLEAQIQTLGDTHGAYQSRFIELASPLISRLERMWREDRATRYTMESARQRFLANWEMQKKFKLSSDKDKRELFYGILKLPVVEETAGKKASTGVEAVKASIKKHTDNFHIHCIGGNFSATKKHAEEMDFYKELLETYEESESAETLLNSFAKPWLGSISNGRLHPRFNPCGTVSYRLSGFKPYLLNAPFDESGLMECLRCDEGWEGVHADFVSIEPAVTAHYSQDPGLLKVFREGLGDVYLDLALTLFPNDESLRKRYNPLAPITHEVKIQFKQQRAVAKTIQLAVQYTGTEYAVRKNLMYAGIDCTLSEAKFMVEAYWKHFHKVRVMNEILFLKFEKQGYLRNAIGRVIRVPTYVNIKRKDGTIWEKPTERYKDLPNRFIQSSAHDILSLWVLIIARRARESGLRAKPVLLDCHDSTSWQAPKEEVVKLEEIFKEALTELNNTLKLSVPIRVELKRFTTLAGLKGEE